MRVPLLAAFSLCLSAAATAAPAFAQEHEGHSHAGESHAGSLGEVRFENSGALAAQQSFLRGLALLHSFEYRNAAESFREAQRIDAGFAMAYYGEALTHAHLLWGEDDPAGARAVLGRLGATPEARIARAKTPRERAYAAAIEAFHSDTDLPGRTRAFADAMRDISARYPDDVDAAAFTALALMFHEYSGGLPPDQRPALRSEAIGQAERAFVMMPAHPGGVHYLIHAADDPDYAARGEAAARVYAALAPDAEHALHMPSHIFLQLGLWDEVVASNERSWPASRAESARRGDSPLYGSFHTLYWLAYGYLQQGRFEAARATIDTARSIVRGIEFRPNEVDGRFIDDMLVFALAANTADWRGDVCSMVPVVDAPTAGPSATRARGFTIARTAEVAVAEVQCGRIDGAASRIVRESTDPFHRRVASVLDALEAQRSGNAERAVELLTPLASATERPPVGPPNVLRTQELLGNALLAAGRPGEAVARFERALEITPNRAFALLGLARAHAAAGNADASRAAYRRLAENWSRADADHPLVREVRERAR